MVAPGTHDVRLGDYTLTIAGADNIEALTYNVTGPDDQLSEQIARSFAALGSTKAGRRLVWELITTSSPRIYQEDADDLADYLINEANIPPSCPE